MSESNSGSELETASEELSLLLIEDNPGDARLIEEMLRDAEELSQRIDPDLSDGHAPHLHHESRLSTGVDYLESTHVDAVLLDLNLPDSTGIDTLERVAELTETAPIVVLTGVRDRDVGVRAIKRGAQDYLVKDEVTSELLVRSIHHAIERRRQERERARRREQLEAINRLNRISQDVTHIVITTTSREDLEQRVCERLADQDAYRFAWIGTVDRGGQRVTPRASAGVEEGYLDEIQVTIDDSETAQGPTGRAIQTREVQVMQDILRDPGYEPWREQAEERGYQSSAAVPIVYEDVLHGVLNVYASSPSAFSDLERDILTRIGSVVGHSIAAIERKDALVDDSAMELELQVEGFADPIAELSARHDGSVEFEQVIRSGDEGLLLYGSGTGLSSDEFRDAAVDVDWVEEVRVLTPGTEAFEFELYAPDGLALLEVVATYGGRIDSAVVSDGDVNLILELPHGTDTRRLLEGVEEIVAGAVPVAQRTTDRSGDHVVEHHSTLEDRLTEKQRTALRTAFFAGYFDWPRESTGEEVAQRLDISPATFTQHLRTAERKFFEAVFEE